MGYYPTPLGVVDRIRTFVRYPDDRVNLLDPCCGEGDALRRPASGDRTEGTFLRGTTDYLQPGGLLVCIIPQHRVTERVARYLAHRYDDLISFRFPDEAYEQFRQAVVFGVRKPEPSLPGDDLEELVGIPFRDLRESRLWTRLEEDGRRNGRMGRPPLPLHSGHLGLLLASGYLDGVVGEGDDRPLASCRFVLPRQLRSMTAISSSASARRTRRLPSSRRSSPPRSVSAPSAPYQ